MIKFVKNTIEVVKQLLELYKLGWCLLIIGIVNMFKRTES